MSQRDRTRTERLAAHEVTLVLAVPSRNAALDDELAVFELTLHESTSGYHLVKGFPLPLLVIDLGVVAEREDDDLLRWFAGRAPQTVDARRWVRQHLAEKGADMTMNATPDLEGYEEFVARLLTAEQRAKTLTPEERVAGLTPEQRLAGLAPEEVANALTPEMALLALPDVALRALQGPPRDALRRRSGEGSRPSWRLTTRNPRQARRPRVLRPDAVPLGRAPHPQA